MRPVGITIMRGWSALHYPLLLTLESFKPIHNAVVVIDSDDPEKNEIRQRLPHWCTTVELPWWLTGVDGDTLGRRKLMAGLYTAINKLHATHILYLEGDECMREEHVRELLDAAPPVAWLPRLQLWQQPRVLRLDWTYMLARWTAVEHLIPELNRATGDGSLLPVKPEYQIQQCPHWPVFHLSRIGSPKMIAKRRRAIAQQYASEGKMEVPDKYDFISRRYECWVPGKMPPAVEGVFSRYTGVLPDGVDDWVEADIKIGGD